jgi:hypothetical protein
MELTKEMIQRIHDSHRGFQGVQSKDDAQVQAICDLAIAGLDRPAVPVEANREARLVEALKVCEQDRVRLYGDGQTLKDAISNQVDDALAAYSEVKP